MPAKASAVRRWRRDILGCMLRILIEAGEPLSSHCWVQRARSYEFPPPPPGMTRPTRPARADLWQSYLYGAIGTLSQKGEVLVGYLAGTATASKGAERVRVYSPP